MGKWIDKEKVKKEFASYISDFDANDGKIKLKIDHTYRVADLCEQIANSIELDEDEVELAWLLGMLHDIGRFKQVREYGTFDDAKSMDHALASTIVLFDEGAIRNYIASEEYDDIIYHAVRWHNAFRMPADLPKRVLLFCNLLRDADKVDIFKVNTDISLEIIYGEAAKNAPFEEVTEAVMEDYKKQQCVLRAKKKNSIDHVAGHASLAFELVFPKSLEIACEQGYLKKLLLYPTQNELAKKQFEQMRFIMQKHCLQKGVTLDF